MVREEGTGQRGHGFESRQCRDLLMCANHLNNKHVHLQLNKKIDLALL